MHRFKRWRLSFKFAATLLLSVGLSLLFYKAGYSLFRQFGPDFINQIRNQQQIEQKLDKLAKQTPKLYLHPKTSQDKKALKRFVHQHDDYSSIYIQDHEDNLVKWSEAAILAPSYYGWMGFFIEPVWDLQIDIASLEDNGFSHKAQFMDGTATLVWVDYEGLRWVQVYYWSLLALCLLLLILPSAIFISRKVRYINQLKEGVLGMAQGNLAQAIPVKSQDELGILAHEMNQLRLSLDDNIQREKEARQANKELVTMLSHDLRTPLTSLTGYLEIMRHQQKMDYLDQCIDKVQQINTLSKNLFEYALVFADVEDFEKQTITKEKLENYVVVQLEYLQMAGFQVDAKLEWKMDSLSLQLGMIKRMINNLVSNIEKYADPNQPVVWQLTCMKHQLSFSIVNSVGEKRSDIESHQIGLRSIQRIVGLHQGQFHQQTDGQLFMIQIDLPC